MQLKNIIDLIKSKSIMIHEHMMELLFDSIEIGVMVLMVRASPEI